MALKHEYILNPVTALEFYQSRWGSLLVLAGEGSFLKVFDARTWKLLCLCEIFDGQTVHGIVVRKDANRGNVLQIAIWGGSCLILLNRDDFEQLLAQEVSSLASSATTLSDWILDVAISLHDDTCVLVTAHNTVLQTRLVESGKATSTELASPSRSILYSADIIWESPSQILVAAGTVFGEIIVWRCSTSGGCQILFTFSGHDGSIFGVDISPPIVRSNGTVSRVLASCSDDRTIRVWDLTTASSSDSANSAIAIRETGFGDNGSLDDAQVGNRCIATVMAHASRIWRVKFLLEPLASTFSPIRILSFGEDSTVQQWCLDLETCSRVQTGSVNSVPGTKVEMVNINTPGAVKLSQLSTFAYHSGKSIWSAAILCTESSASLLATGGADGKISLYDPAALIWAPDENRLSLMPTFAECPTLPINSIIPDPESSRSNSWALEDALKSCTPSQPVEGSALKESQPQLIIAEDVSTKTQVTNGIPMKSKKSKKPKKAVRDAFSRYAFVSENQVLATTTFGRVLLADIDANAIWSEVILPESALQDLRSYTVVKGFAETGTAIIASSSGKIYAYRHETTLQVVGNVEGKVADMFKVFNSQTNTFELLVTTLTGGVATLFAVECLGDGTVRLFAKAMCNLPDKFVVTSAGRCSSLLVMGARSGLLAFYDAEKSAEPINVWKPVINSATDAITTILPLPTSISDECASHFLTTERTGYYSIFSLNADKDSGGAVVGATVGRVHHGSLPFGPMVEAAWFQGGDLILYGFKSKSFVVWNETKQCEISNIDCGGAHRSYAYSPVGSMNGGHFVYNKASKLYCHSHRKPSHIVAKQGGHGREIKACAVSSDSGMIATGAEDTAIRIWRYESNTSHLDAQLNCIAVIQGHTAGIQHLQWYQSEYLFSSGGNEEFFVWAVRFIPGFGIGVVREAICPDNSADRDLRIMSFDVTELPPSRNTTSSRSLLISLAYSNSTIRTYAYSRSGGFELLAQGRYTSSCLTQIRHFQVLDDHVYLLTAATDGNLTLWKGNIIKSSDIGAGTARHVITSSRKIHQSTIKSLDLMIKSDNMVVATGGDDNALGVSIYPMPCLQDATLIPRVFVLRSAHSAAITGVSLVPIHSDISAVEAFAILSSGNDQRVKEWQVQLGRGEESGTGSEHGLELCKVADIFTSVADVADLSILKNDRDRTSKVLVVGNGVELWRI